jgi:tRNA 2-selenouridine synthase
MNEALRLDDFLLSAKSIPVIDVRSPKEYHQAHIKGAINIPLLDNENRAIVGTTFKESGREQAVIRGFELVGSEFGRFINEAKIISPQKKILIYCWRGGMRSNIMSWVLKTAGFETHTLTGGYKSYRRWASTIFKQEKNIRILGGLTGSGKTEILKSLEMRGELIIDLEGLANHKGSAFGSLGLGNQPTNEQFENDLALAWDGIDSERVVWLEDESHNIGKIKIPDSIFEMMKSAKVIKVSIPEEIRMKKLVEDYSKFPKEMLKECTMKISKRLGNLRLNQSLAYLEQGDMENWIKMMLEYYDKAYLYCLSQRDADTIVELNFDTDDLDIICNRLLIL